MSGRGLRVGIVALLAVEVLDELVFGAREAAWPLIRRDLDLSYAEVGLLLSIPAYVSTVAEPGIGLLGDTRWRRAVVAGGGVAFALSLVGAALSDSFWPLLIAFIVLFPASGAFVSLSQATLMDLDPRSISSTRSAPPSKPAASPSPSGPGRGSQEALRSSDCFGGSPASPTSARACPSRCSSTSCS